MNKLIEFLQNNPIIILVTFIISVLSGISIIIGIILGWERIRDDILLKKITVPVYAYLIILFLVVLVIIFWPAIEDRPKRLRTIKGESFGIQRVYLDGKRFVNCTFDGTELVFRGEAGLDFSHNNLKDIRLTLDGSAARTVIFFMKLYTEPGFRPFIENIFEAIKGGKLPESIPPSGAADD
jgi:hypothetical protein